MTDRLQNKVNELKQAIEDSEEYRQYMNLKKLLEETPELMKRVNDFRASNFEMAISTEGKNREMVAGLSKEYADILEDSVVSSYLNAELVLCKLLREINEVLLSGIELELDFL